MAAAQPPRLLLLLLLLQKEQRQSLSGRQSGVFVCARVRIDLAERDEPADLHTHREAVRRSTHGSCIDKRTHECRARIFACTACCWW